MLLKVIVFSEISKLACPLQKGALPLQVMTMAWRSWASEPSGAPAILSWAGGNDTKATEDGMAEDEIDETVLFPVTAISWDISCC